MRVLNFFRHVWAYFQTIQAPALPTTIQAVAPLAPMSQEQFADVHDKRMAETAQLAQNYSRIIKTANAHVTRNYGRGPVVISSDPTVAPLTADERTWLTTGPDAVKIVTPKAHDRV